MRKEAISIYNPQDPVEATFQEAYHDGVGGYMTAGELKSVMRSLPTFRALSNKVHRDPKAVSTLLFGEVNHSQWWYYPCDIVELRSLLTDKAITYHAPVLLFSPKTASRLMAEYPLMLVLDRSVVKTGRDLGGVVLMEGNRLHLAHALKRVMIRSYLNSKQAQTVYSIIREACGFIPTFLIHDLPGLAREKVAACHPATPPDEATQKVREDERAKKVDEWWDEYHPLDSNVFVTPDFKKVTVSLGDCETDRYDELTDALREALGPGVEVEMCDECGKPDGYLYLHPRLGETHDIGCNTHTGGIMRENWYTRIKKQATGPAETFDKPFLIGLLPDEDDPEVMKQDYATEASKLREKYPNGCKCVFRYTDLKLPMWSKTKAIPLNRSLISKPKTVEVVRIDNDFIHIRVDGEKEEQKLPLAAYVFLTKISEE